MKTIFKAIIIVACISLSCLTGKAQEKTGAVLDAFFTEQSNSGGLNGNVFVEDHDIVVFKKSFGYQDVDKQVPNTDSSAFAMASVTKIFTATAILQLKEKGLVQLDDNYSKYYPDFPYPEITIRQLLAHTSGLPAYELFDSLAKALPEQIFGNCDVLPALTLWHKPLHNTPGDGWSYSSMNYCLLAVLVEKLSGLTLQNYFIKYIFEPAGMEHSYLENYLTVRNNLNRTVNYEIPRRSSKPVDVNKIPADRQMVYNCGGFVGQGGLVTTTGDLAKFDKAYFSGKLLSSASVAEATTPTKLNDGRPAVFGTLLGKGIAAYGLGWCVGVHPQLGQIVWHTGGRPGITTIYVHDVARQQTIFIFENFRNNDRLEHIASTTLHIINGIPAPEFDNN